MTLGERMKGYEFQSRTSLLKRTPVIIRLDGKAFHTFTRGLDKPFDFDFTDAMENTMLELCKNIQGCVFGYTQSDEITLVLIDYQKIDTCALFDNEVQKLVSVSASMATLFFNKEVKKISEKYRETFFNNDRLILPNKLLNLYQERTLLWESKLFKAMFDSRAFNLPKEEVCNNLIWRQQDATRNSINSLAQSLYSQKQINGIKSNDLQNKMLTEKNVNWNDLDTCFKRGSACIKDSNGEWFIDLEMPILTENRDYIEKRIKFDE